ncbi:hypothetical protein OQX61_11340 [Pedobacter sp. PLR]|uniref:Bor/Iss family lipoprotein n=1 Tax=Pedobacter sp. PLR TaxID=2994465 RepID=UPI0022464FCD|nr:hypothetical protein [Pedobacter sp. PLR]MCX2451854.1 hypothetical protein [Pedobacter sp. PLR]
MKKNVTLLSCLTVVLLMSSCYTAKVAHGTLTTDSPVVKVNSKKNHALIEGLVPLGDGYAAKKYVGDRTNYVTKSQITFVDGLLRVITLGIYTPSTTTFYVPLSDVTSK